MAKQAMIMLSWEQKTIMQIAQFSTHLSHLNQSDCTKLSKNLHNSVNNPRNNMQIESAQEESCKTELHVKREKN